MDICVHLVWAFVALCAIVAVFLGITSAHADEQVRADVKLLKERAHYLEDSTDAHQKELEILRKGLEAVKAVPTKTPRL